MSTATKEGAASNFGSKWLKIGFAPLPYIFFKHTLNNGFSWCPQWLLGPQIRPHLSVYQKGQYAC